MNAHFARLMRAATESTTKGDLHAATRMIRQALAGRSAAPDPDSDPARSDGEVIDIRFREVVSAPTDPAANGNDFGNDFGEGSAQVLRGVHRTAFGARQYRLFVPASGAAHAPALIVMLHGCTQDADDFALGTGMDELAAKAGAIVLYPEQSRRDNPNGCWHWFEAGHQRRDRGECHILADMLQSLSARHRVNSSRIYVAGMSAGGAMAAVLCDQYPDLFQGLGVHSGLPAGRASSLPAAIQLMARRSASAGSMAPGPAVPTIVFHGTADQTVSPVNGQDLFDTAVARAGSARLTVHSESGARAGRQFTRTLCTTSDPALRHEHWAIQGAGHAWSGGNPRGSFAEASGPSASAEMLRFFLAA